MIDHTHDPSTKSWVASAEVEACDFPLQNLPYGRWREHGSGGAWRSAVAIGDCLLDLAATGLVSTSDITEVLRLSTTRRRELRHGLFAALREGSPSAARLAQHLVPLDQAEIGLPCDVRDYTDFYTGIHHARKVGSLLRPDSPLLPNYKWVPIGYHGRASSLVPSGTTFRRPVGQVKPPHLEVPRLAPSTRLDFELEMGIIVGVGNALGERIPLDDAEAHIVGMTLLNDWSARDLQTWEYQPLGPFLAKNFATTLSPWIVTMEALVPFRGPFTRPETDPQPLAYLDSPALRSTGQLDIALSVELLTDQMREAHARPYRLSHSNAQDAYWTIAQLVAHHTVNGCNLSTGDVLGTGTLSGALPEQAGSLLELSDGGKAPVALPTGEVRTFLEDGDEIILRGECRRPGFRRIGFGECRGRVLPAN